MLGALPLIAALNGHTALAQTSSAQTSLAQTSSAQTLLAQANTAPNPQSTYAAPLRYDNNSTGTINIPPTRAAPGSKLENLEAAIKAYQDRDFLRASSFAITAYDAGSMDAAVLLGHMSRKGERGPVNYVDARQWYEKAAAMSHIDAIMALSEMGLKQQGGLTTTDAAGYLSRAADRGNIEAMKALSDLYLSGDGVTKNEVRAREYLARAAESFDPEASKKLGDTHLSSDPNKALSFYEIAADAGHIDAAYIAGVMYAENFDIRPNPQRSAQLLKKAATGGHAAAQADYGLLVYQGSGAAQSDEDAAQWFKKSAQGGDSEGQFLYAYTLAKGEGLTQDFEEAYYWILRSTDSGVDEYDKDRAELRKRLEDNVDPDILARARARFSQ